MTGREAAVLTRGLRRPRWRRRPEWSDSAGMLRRRVLGGGAAALMVVAAMSGCGSHDCPAVGWLSTLVVEAGDASAVAGVEVCVPDGCLSSVDAAPATASGGACTGSPWVMQLSDSSWSFTFSERPADVDVRSLAEGGEVLAQTSVTPSWERVGGTEECGGPMEASVTAPA